MSDKVGMYYLHCYLAPSLDDNLECLQRLSVIGGGLKNMSNCDNKDMFCISNGVFLCCHLQN